MVPGSTGVNKARQENEEEFEWEKTSYKTSKKSRKKNARTAQMKRQEDRTKMPERVRNCTTSPRLNNQPQPI